MNPLVKGWRMLTRARAEIDPELREVWLPRVLDQVDARLRHTTQAPQAYLPGLATALNYCRTLAQQVPGPVDVDRRSFATDATVHTLFGSADGIAQALVRSEEARDWLRQRPTETRPYALLAVRRRDKQALGMVARDGYVQHDVAQTYTLFTDHSFTNLAESEAQARERLVHCFMDSLAAQVRERVHALQAERQRLSNGALCPPRPAPGAAAGQGARGLAAVQTDLGQLAKALELRAYPGHIAAVMEAPERYLRARAITIELDPMGLQPHTAGADIARLHALRLHELMCRDRRQWHVLLVRCDLSEVPSYSDRLQSEARWLTI